MLLFDSQFKDDGKPQPVRWRAPALTVPLDWLNEHALELESSFFGAR